MQSQLIWQKDVCDKFQDVDPQALSQLTFQSNQLTPAVPQSVMSIINELSSGNISLSPRQIKEIKGHKSSKDELSLPVNDSQVL